MPHVAELSIAHNSANEHRIWNTASRIAAAGRLRIHRKRVLIDMIRRENRLRLCAKCMCVYSPFIYIFFSGPKLAAALYEK